MSIRTKSLLIGVAVAGLVLLWVTIFPSKKKEKLHSVRIALQVTPTPASTFNDEEVMMLTEKALSERIKATGYPFTIKKANARSMEITLKDVDNIFVAKQVIGGNSKVSFWEVYNIQMMAPFLGNADTIAANYLNPVKEKAPEPESEPEPEDTTGPLKRFRPEDKPEVQEQRKGLYTLIQFLSEPYTGGDGKTVFPAALGYVNTKDTALVRKIFSDAGGSLPHGAKFYYGPADVNSKDSKEIMALYAISTKGRLTAPVGNEDIAHAEQGYDQTGNPQVTLEFTPSGSRKWATMTAQNVGRAIAIIVDDRVISAPTVNAPIDGGTSQISGGFTVDEAQALALQLSSPGTPADLKILSMEIVDEKGIVYLKLLLLAAIGFIIGTGAAFFIFKMLKTS
jgi:SecD/SecF fusion protein